MGFFKFFFAVKTALNSHKLKLNSFNFVLDLLLNSY